ncbi:uncharacterized protein LOC141631065 [Silene latifolia]|uniref:uncharacterized protein LOC141631065 n=1 Tax=Silene latifolia TaxID=37657 RepID=UPI003D77416C
MKKLKSLKNVLKALNKECYYDIENKATSVIQLLGTLLEQLSVNPNDPDLIAREIEASAEAKDLTKARDSFLNQKAKIEDQHGIQCGDSHSIQTAFLEYYLSLLGSRKSTAVVRADVLEKGHLCTNEHAEILNSGFFKESWDVIGQEICGAVSDFFVTGRLITQLNATNVTLIPKIERPTSVTYFRPIAFCNLIYKMFKGLKFSDQFTQKVMMCIKTTSFILSLNGSAIGYFKGQRGLRQGNPISPLIFTMCMDYLTRLIKFATDTWPFKYHPMCKTLKLTHLMFADDLFMFCKGNANSIMLLMRAFSSFSQTSGLSMNNAKSEIFFNGMKEDLKSDIKQVTGFTEGSMPFRYLGVPIQAGRLTKKECTSITEKMVARIRGLGAKKLSYAGRITLINSVLNTLYNYCATMFIIPKSVIKRIEDICRNFLWDGSSEYHRVPLVAWDTAELWNIATVGKLVDWVYCKADRLWIRWINQGYSIRRGYDWLRTSQPAKAWASIVCNNWNILKHSIITWITMNEGLNVKEKLRKVRTAVECWTGMALPTVSVLLNGNRKTVQWKVLATILNAVYYNIWMQINNARVS